MASCKKIKILIFGGTKFIGKALIDAMDQKDFKIDVLSKKKTTNKKIYRFYKTELKYFEKFVIKKKYDYIIDFISKDKNLLRKILLKVNFNKYIFISTVWLAKIDRYIKLDQPIKKVLLGNQVPKITKKYLINKHKLESLILDMSSKKNNKLYILRLPIILGNNDVTERLNFYTKRSLDGGGQIILKNRKIDLNLLHVDDLCTGIIKLIKNKQLGNSKFLEALNLTTISYENFLKKINIKVGIKKRNFFYLNKQFIEKKYKNYFKYNPFLNEVPLNITKNNIFKLTNFNPKPFIKYIKKIKLKVDFSKSLDHTRKKEINFLNKL